MTRVLAEAFEAMRVELNSLPPCAPSRSPGADGTRTDSTLGDDRTLALLEQYSRLLLSAVEKRMDNKIWTLLRPQQDFKPWHGVLNKEFDILPPCLALLRQQHAPDGSCHWSFCALLLKTCLDVFAIQHGRQMNYKSLRVIHHVGCMIQPWITILKTFLWMHMDVFWSETLLQQTVVERTLTFDI